MPETFPGTFWCPDLLSTRDLGPQGVQAVLHLAELMKSRPSVFQRSLAGKQMVMFFEKPSLRTRLTFEAGMTSPGGTAIACGPVAEPTGCARDAERHCA